MGGRDPFKVVKCQLFTPLGYKLKQMMAIAWDISSNVSLLRRMETSIVSPPPSESLRGAPSVCVLIIIGVTPPTLASRPYCDAMLWITQPGDSSQKSRSLGPYRPESEPIPDKGSNELSEPGISAISELPWALRDPGTNPFPGILHQYREQRTGAWGKENAGAETDKWFRF